MKSISYPFIATIVVVLLTFWLLRAQEDYFNHTLRALLEHPLSYSIASFVILASDILLPVPSSIVMYLNGYVLGTMAGGLLSMCSALCGSALGYYLGRYSARFFKADDQGQAQALLVRYGPAAIFLSRGIPVLAESICIVCGYNRMPFGRYMFLNVLGFVPVCFLQAFLGHLGDESRSLFLLSFGGSILLSAVFWLFVQKRLPTA